MTDRELLEKALAALKQATKEARMYHSLIGQIRERLVHGIPTVTTREVLSIIDKKVPEIREVDGNETIR